MARLSEKGVTILTEMQIVSVEENGVVLKDKEGNLADHSL